MILKNFSKFLSLFIILFFTSQVHGDEKIEIWKNQNLKKENNLIDYNDMILDTFHALKNDTILLEKDSQSVGLIFSRLNIFSDV